MLHHLSTNIHRQRQPLAIILIYIVSDSCQPVECYPESCAELHGNAHQGCAAAGSQMLQLVQTRTKKDAEDIHCSQLLELLHARAKQDALEKTNKYISPNGYASVAQLTDIVAHAYKGMQTVCDDWGGRNLALQLLESSEPLIVLVSHEGSSWNEFSRTLLAANKSISPFVLVAINSNGGMSTDDQKIAQQFQGLKACYSNNLMRTIDTALFKPLPVGIPTHYDDDLKKQMRRIIDSLWKSNSLPKWEDRDNSVLLIFTVRTNPRRQQWMELLSKREYRGVVQIVSVSDVEGTHKPLDAYLKLMSNHKAVLSPPGFGFDCWRTWEALAVGSVPLIDVDEMYRNELDLRLYEETGAVMASLEKMTPRYLRRLISKLQDPRKFSDTLKTDTWKLKWQRHLYPPA